MSDLRANAINVWLDEEQIKVGESITEKTANGLSRCTHLVIILSENFRSSRWCTTELRTILHREIKEHKNQILPVQIGPIAEAAWVQVPLIFMADILRVDLSGPVYQKNLPSLLRAIAPIKPVTVTNINQQTIDSGVQQLLSPSNFDKINFRNSGLIHTFDFIGLNCFDDDPSNALSYITEENVHFLHLGCGFTVNFSVRNIGSNVITIYSIEPEVLKSFDETSSPYKAFCDRLPSRLYGLSGWIGTHVMKVQLSHISE